MELAQLQTAAMFAAESPSAQDADDAWVHVDEIDNAIAREVPRLTRWRRRLDPRRIREPVEI
jgi:hypothetical protein